MVLKTDRLILRNMGQEDYEALCRILKDNDVMYAYEGAFSDREVQEWLDRQTERYHQYGFGLWAVTLKDSGRMIGQCGLTMQDYREKQVLEVGYLFEKAYWHHGYAVEAAAACRDYAFNQLDAEEVYSIIRDSNTASQKVAQRNGMRYRDTIVKHYKGVTMPHHVYSVKRKTESISLCGVDCTDCEYFGQRRTGVPAVLRYRASRSGLNIQGKKSAGFMNAVHIKRNCPIAENAAGCRVLSMKAAIRPNRQRRMRQSFSDRWNSFRTGHEL